MQSETQFKRSPSPMLEQVHVTEETQQNDTDQHEVTIVVTDMPDPELN